MMPVVHLYATCWNDAFQLPWFFRHYDALVTRYVIFDDGSTDGSLDLLKGHPRVELRRFQRVHVDSFVLSELALFNHCWKESRGSGNEPPADWVVVCSLDEHLVHDDLSTYLERCRTSGVTVVPALGFQMFMPDFPGPDERLSETRTRGIPDHYDCKLCVFSPTAIDEINYEPGGHVAAPTGRVLAPASDELVLRHYQFLGIEFTARRFAHLRQGLGTVDRANGWGWHYDQSKEDLARQFAEYASRAIDVSVEPQKYAVPPEWWNRLSRR